MLRHSSQLAAVVVVAGLCSLLLSATASAQSVVEADRERIQAHLTEVEHQLRARDVSHLSPELQRERQRNLDVLREYRQAGEFPRNTYVEGRRPVFIDRGDRACAVAHLMIESGWERQARRIRQRENLAYLPDMESPEVEQWVAESGLTAEEAARIQPTYESCYDSCGCEHDPVCGEDGNTYVNSCMARNCGGVDRWLQGCCEQNDHIEWSGGDYGFPQTSCSNDPNEESEQLCPTGNDPSEADEDDWQHADSSRACTSLAAGPTAVFWLVVAVMLIAVRRCVGSGGRAKA